MELISDQLWARLKAQARKTKRRSYVAVAYLSPGAFERLPLRPGSLLIVNCNEATVKGGQTDPREVKKYLDHGVIVHNVSNLHAKVFVLGTRAFVGSANISNSSENLLEAAIVTIDRRLIHECKRFVQSLFGEEVTPTELERLIPLFDPRRFNRLAARKQINHRPRKIAPQHNPLWAVRTADVTWQEADYEAERTAKSLAEKRLTSSDFKISDFNWSASNSAFVRGVRVGDVILQMHEESARKVFLHPPRKVVLVKRYKGGKRMMVFLEQRKRLRDRTMKDVRSKLPNVAKFLHSVRLAQMIREPNIVHDVQNLWGLD